MDQNVHECVCERLCDSNVVLCQNKFSPFQNAPPLAWVCVCIICCCYSYVLLLCNHNNFQLASCCVVFIKYLPLQSVNQSFSQSVTQSCWHALLWQPNWRVLKNWHIGTKLALQGWMHGWALKKGDLSLFCFLTFVHFNYLLSGQISWK